MLFCCALWWGLRRAALPSLLFLGLAVSRPRKPPPLSWSEIGVLAVLGGLVVIGLAANHLSLVQSLVTLSLGAEVLLIAWRWQVTLREAETEPPLTRWGWVWQAVVFVAFLTVVGLLVWYFIQRHL